MTLSTLDVSEDSQPTGTAPISTDTDPALTAGTHDDVPATTLRKTTVVSATQRDTDTHTASDAGQHRRTTPPMLAAIKAVSWIVFAAIFALVGVATANEMFGQVQPSAPAYVQMVDRIMLIAGGLLGALFGTMASYLFSLTAARMLGFTEDDLGYDD